jgi:hypothetical protein
LNDKKLRFEQAQQPEDNTMKKRHKINLAFMRLLAAITAK